MSCPTLTLDPHTLAVRPPAVAPPDPADDALAAIASTYEDARAGIISGEPSPAVVPAGYSPTVPLTLLAHREPAEPAEDTSTLGGVATLWSRLLRRVGPGGRGRHAAEKNSVAPDRMPQRSPVAAADLISSARTTAWVRSAT